MKLCPPSKLTQIMMKYTHLQDIATNLILLRLLVVPSYLTPQPNLA